MPVDEIMGHQFQPACNHQDFLLHGEQPNRCLVDHFGLSDMPLRKINSQLVCGACRARSSFSPCRTVIELNVASLIPHPDYRETRTVLRARFQAALAGRRLAQAAEAVMRDAEQSIVIALHLTPLSESGDGGGFYLAEGDSGHERPLALSWWIFCLEQVLAHVYAACVRVHVFTEAGPSGGSGGDEHADLAALRARFPALSFRVHGPEVPAATQFFSAAKPDDFFFFPPDYDCCVRIPFFDGLPLFYF